MNELESNFTFIPHALFLTQFCVTSFPNSKVFIIGLPPFCLNVFHKRFQKIKGFLPKWAKYEFSPSQSRDIPPLLSLPEKGERTYHVKSLMFSQGQTKSHFPLRFKSNVLKWDLGPRTTLILLNPFFWSTDLMQLSSFLWKGKAFWKEFKLSKVCNKSTWLVRLGCFSFGFNLVLHLPAPLATCSSKPAYLSCVWATWRCFENLEWSKCWWPSDIWRWQ